MDQPGGGQQVPHSGVGQRHAYSHGAPHPFLGDVIGYKAVQEDITHSMDDLTHDQHQLHGHNLHLLDIHVLLHRLAGSHCVPCCVWPGARPVDSHIEAGLPLLHHTQRD